MGKIISTLISREDLDKGFIPINYVMVESDKTIEGKKTKGGIIYGHDEDIQFAEEGTSWEADVADVYGRVYKVPHKLYYNKEDQSNSMSWKTDMELQVGDLVWYPPIEARNATAFECEGKLFKLIPYSDLIVAKRDIWIEKEYFWTENNERKARIIKDSTENIMLNGRCLLEYVNKPKTSSLAFKEEIDPTKGIIRFYGVPNKEYIRDEYFDFQDLDEGDLILLQPNTPLVPLERKSFNAHFNKDKMYFVVQRRRIAMVLSKGN
jgi:hypothetical protein